MLSHDCVTVCPFAYVALTVQPLTLALELLFRTVIAPWNPLPHWPAWEYVAEHAPPGGGDDGGGLEGGGLDGGGLDGGGLDGGGLDGGGELGGGCVAFGPTPVT